MKKILSMVLCILMVMSVFAIPMSVSASSATVETFDPTTTTSYTVEFDGVDAYVYSWTPAATGTLTLVDTCADAWVIVENAADWFDCVALDGNAGAEGVTFDVTAGTAYNVIVKTWSEAAGTVTFDATFAEKTEGTMDGQGTYENPYVIDDTVTELPAIAMGESAYYAITADPITTYNLTVLGGNMMDSFDLYVINGDTTVSAMRGQALVENITPFMATQKIVFCITNTALGEGGPYTFTLEANEASTLGTADDPDTLVLDTITTADIAGSTYYYTYTATEDGTLSIQMMITTDWVCSISGGEADAAYMQSDYEEVVNPVTYPVKAGEEITVWVATTAFSAGQVYFQATFEAAPVLPEHTYNVAGQAGLCGVDWTPSENQMTYDGDGTWSITFTDIAAGTYEFKVVEDGAWNNPDFNLEGSANGGSNAKVTVDVDGSTVIIGFDGTKAIIEDIIAPETEPATEPSSEPATEPSTEPSTDPVEDPTEPTEPTTTYNVAGAAGLCGTDWDPAQNQMTYDGDGTWSITFENIAAGTYEFKVVEGGAWGNPDYNLDGNAAGGGGNAVVTVDVDGSTVVIGFDGEKAVIEDVIAPVVEPTEPSEPATDDEKPATGDEKPATGDEKPATGDEKPATGDEKPATGDEKPATGDEKPATGDEKPATGDEYELGDVNRDGKLSIQDATLIQKYLAKMEELDEEQLVLANYNGDGKISIQDATMIQKKLAHII